ncbi:hypothetical protein STCU_03473 [Strigomonas culicis]|uniref:Uncharacterized protein n=1 Tax=Strigomonas culicis TaxID=28005 RepID=S9UR79_9TRYP|nr:hypothetical protein STCU_03473 [Strigomonas culicis]|eukprot:EPY31403.1 hypothetical protein STCU_03473 [Strigomonas culicis]
MNFLLFFTILILSWSLDSTDPDVQRIIYYCFYVTHFVLLVAVLYVFMRIWQVGSVAVVKFKDPYTDEEQTKTAWEYDVMKLRELLMTKIGMAAGVGLFAAGRFHIVFPLLMQCLYNPRMLYDSELFKIYVLGQPAEGSLLRPWKETTYVPEWVKSSWAQSAKDSDQFLTNNTMKGRKVTGRNQK